MSTSELNTMEQEFKSSLKDLTNTSKPQISMLTILADEYKEGGHAICKAIKTHIYKVPSNQKLPCLYLIDSIIKNHKHPYVKLFTPHIIDIFCEVFGKVDEKTRAALFKVRQTWKDVFPPKLLFELDTRVHEDIDPAWPIFAQPAEKPSIHVNPKFIKKEDLANSSMEEAEREKAAAIKKQEEREKAEKAAEAEAEAEAEDRLRVQLLAKQRELMLLQQKQLDFELEQAKLKLAAQAKALEQRSAEVAHLSPPTVKVEAPEVPVIHAPPTVSRDPRLKSTPSLSMQQKESTKSPAPVSSEKRASSSESHKKKETSPSKSSSTHNADKKSSKPDKEVRSKSSSSSTKRSSSSNRTSHSSSSDKTKKHSSKSSSSKSSSASKHSSKAHSKSPDKQEKEEKKKDADAQKVARNYRKRTVSPDGDSNSAAKKKRLSTDSSDENEEDQPSRQARRFAVRSRQVEGPGRSHRAKRDLSEELSIEEHERLASQIATGHKKMKLSDNVEIDDDNDGKTPLEVSTEDKDERKGRPHPSSSKPLSSDLAGLFGTHDVDYRKRAKLPPIPKLAPEARAGCSSDNSSQESQSSTLHGAGPKRWASFKADRPDQFPDLPQSPSAARTAQGFVMKDATQILEQADRQLQDGDISLATHKDIVCSVHQFYQLQKQRQQVVEGVHNLREPLPEHEFHARYPANSFKQPLLPSPWRSGPLLPNPVSRKPMPNQGHPPSLLHMKIPGLIPVSHGSVPPPPRPPLPHHNPPHMNPPPLPPMALNIPRDPRQKKGALLETPTEMGGQPVPAGVQQHPMHPQNQLPFNSHPISPPPPPGPEESGLNYDPHSLGYDTVRFYVPQHDPRWLMKTRAMKSLPFTRGDGAFSDYEVLLNNRAWSVPVGCPRSVKLPYNFQGRKANKMNTVKILLDLDRRELYLDGKMLYRLGEPRREINLSGNTILIGFQGPKRRLWIDRHPYDIREDAAPEPVLIDGSSHEMSINSWTKMLILDGHDVCPINSPEQPQKAMVAFKEHEFMFVPPPHEILIDGRSCLLEFSGDFPSVNINGELHGICFEGPPREIIINGQPWSVPMNCPRKINIGQRPYHVSFGGPGYEVIIDDEWYEVKFGGDEKYITLGSKRVCIQLPGNPPEVKILGKLTMDYQLEEAIERATVEDDVKRQVESGEQAVAVSQEEEVIHDNTAPAFPAQPVDKENMPATVTPAGLQQQQQRFGRYNKPWVPKNQFQKRFKRGRFNNRMAPPYHRHNDDRMRRDGPPGGQSAAGLHNPHQQQPPTMPVDIDNVLASLLACGIIKKPAAASSSSQPGSAVASPAAKLKNEPAAEEIPELKHISKRMMKEMRFPNKIADLYTGQQCASCGTRFRPAQKEKNPDQYPDHLDWHFKRNVAKQSKAQMNNYRRWCCERQEWKELKEPADLEKETKPQSNFFDRMLQSADVNAQVGEEKKVMTCPVAAEDGEDGDDLCYMCHESFEQFFEEDDECWHLRDAIRHDKKVFHPVCFGDYKEDPTETPEVEEELPDRIYDPLGYLHALGKLNAANVAKKAAAEKEATKPEATSINSNASVSVSIPSFVSSVQSNDNVVTAHISPKQVNVSESSVNHNKTEPTVATFVDRSSITEPVATFVDRSSISDRPKVDDTYIEGVYEELCDSQVAIEPKEEQEPEQEAEPEQPEQEDAAEVEAPETLPGRQHPTLREGITESTVELIVIKPEVMDSPMKSSLDRSSPFKELGSATSKESGSEKLEEMTESEDPVKEGVSQDSNSEDDTMPNPDPIVIKPEPTTPVVSEENKASPLAEHDLKSTPDFHDTGSRSPSASAHRDSGVQRILDENKAVSSPAGTLSDIDDEAIIQAQFTPDTTMKEEMSPEQNRETPDTTMKEEEMSPEQNRENNEVKTEEEPKPKRAPTPTLDEDELLGDEIHQAIINPKKIQITVKVSRKIPKTKTLPPSSLALIKESKPEDKVSTPDEDGGATPLRDEAGTPTLDEASTYDDPPTPLADEPTEGADGEVEDRWSMIPLDDDDSDDMDDIAPYIPPEQTTPVKDEPPPPGEEDFLPQHSHGAPITTADPVSSIAQSVYPQQMIQQQQQQPMMMMPQAPYQYPQQPMLPVPVTTGYNPYMQYAAPPPQQMQASYYMQQSQPQVNDNSFQTLSTVTGHGRSFDNRPYYNNRTEHPNRDNHRYHNDDYRSSSRRGERGGDRRDRYQRRDY